MRTKKLLAAFLLGTGLCLVPALGHGRILTWVNQVDMDIKLLRAEIDYMMNNPTNFLKVSFYYDAFGMYTSFFPEGIDTKDKIYVAVRDNRGVFSDKSGRALLGQFKEELEIIYQSFGPVATDMDTDIVATFWNREQNPLGGFYQGEYHLWGE